MLKKKSIWVLQGVRAGDNAQARELASLLDADTLVMDLKFNALHHFPNIAVGASVVTLTTNSRQKLHAPWPDMVIATGKRAAPVARWIKKQSGRVTKIVHLGRPRARLSAFDLVIATPQYGLPHEPNVVERQLPFATPQKVDSAELEKWQKIWADLPRPLIAVAMGNAKFPLRFGPPDVREFAIRLNDLANQTKGSLLLMASPRTDPSLVDRVAVALNFPYKKYGVFDKDNNPYQAALDLSDRFVATSDSISMISELINTGKPVDVFELPVSGLRVRWSAKQGFAAWLSSSGLLQPPRDVPGMVRKLIEEGAVCRLGSGKVSKPFKRNGDVVVSRLNGLLEN